MNESPTRTLLASIAQRTGGAVVLWRGADLTGRDVDLLVGAGADALVASVCADFGLRPRHEDAGRTLWCWADTRQPELDVVRASHWPRCYPRVTGVLSRARAEDAPLPVASEEDRLLVFAADAVGGREIARLADRCEALLARPSTRERLARLARAESAEPLAVLASDSDALRALARRGRMPYWRAGTVAARSTHARDALRTRAAGRLQAVGPRAVPARGPLVALSGMDGAGKSTAARTAQAALLATGIPTRIAWTRFSDGSADRIERIAVPFKRVLRRPRVSDDPPPDDLDPGVLADALERPRRRTAVGWAWVVLVTLVNVVDSRRAIAARSPDGAVVCDRWTADNLVDLQLRYGRHAVAEWLLKRALPRPDLALLLRVDPVTAAARKPGDQSLGALRAMAVLYDARAAELGLTEVDARAPISQVQAAVERAIRAGVAPDAAGAA